ncbi:MAG: hypothetical protein WD069_03495 [Planctomycetales bacterium]
MSNLALPTTAAAPPAGSAGGSARLAVPSWLVSLALHAGLLVLFASTLKSCGEGGTGFQKGEAFRTVGIVVKSDGHSTNDAATDTNQTDDAPPDPRATRDPAIDAAAVPQASPAPLVLPESVPGRILGPGGLLDLPTAGAGDIRDPFRAGPGTTGPAPGGASLVGVKFMGISDKATRVVYVLDRSSSMAGLRLQVAKTELLASLATLQRNQQFQVIFYNTEPLVMRLDDQQDALYLATDINRTKTRQYVNGIVADLGTNDLPAIRRALRFQPEVIFLLTDGEGLGAADLNEIRQANRSGARIHCVKFGNGPELVGGGDLERLARQNEGTYIYRDIGQFERR